MLGAVAILSLQHKECDKELNTLSAVYNDDILEVKKEISAIEDEKINNDLYNKQQMKLRKRFFKK